MSSTLAPSVQPVDAAAHGQSPKAQQRPTLMAAAWGGQPMQQPQQQQPQKQLQSPVQGVATSGTPAMPVVPPHVSPYIRPRVHGPREYTDPCRTPQMPGMCEIGTRSPSCGTERAVNYAPIPRIAMTTPVPRQEHCARSPPMRIRTCPTGSVVVAPGSVASRADSFGPKDGRTSIVGTTVARRIDNPRSPEASANRGPLLTIKCVRDSLSENVQAKCNSLNSKVQALRGAFDQSVQLVKQAPPLMEIFQDDQQIHVDRTGDGVCTKSTTTCDEVHSLSEALDEGSVSRQEVNSIMAGLQRRLEEHEQQMTAKCTKLSERWETRFTALEQVLSTGLGTATIATTSMNDRLAKFVGLAEVLEGAVQRVVYSDRDLDALSRQIVRLEESTTQKVTEVKNDMACLAEELANSRDERLSWFPPRETPDSRSEACESDYRDDFQPTRADLDRLVRELGEERSLRLQLALQVQDGRCDLERLRSLLDTTNDHLSSLTRELSSAPAGGSGYHLPPEQREAWSQHLESLRVAIRGEIQGEAAGSAPPRRSRRQSPGPGAQRPACRPDQQSNSEGIGCIEEEEQAEPGPSAVKGDAGSDVPERPPSGSAASGAMPSGPDTR